MTARKVLGEFIVEYDRFPECIRGKVININNMTISGNFSIMHKYSFNITIDYFDISMIKEINYCVKQIANEY